ncbi:MAG: glycosyltransferase [Clostridia bacterium]|nr:glycosyltransferase [Clostridia bacterium]
MQKIIFGITGLTLGGAERVLVDIANELVNEYDVTIFTLYGKGEFEKELSDKVKLVNMIDRPYNDLSFIQKLKVSLSLLFNKKSMYKKYIDKGYDTEIAFLEGPITRLFSVPNKQVNKIAWVHNDITCVFGKNIKAKVKRILDKKVYSKYNNVVFVSNDNKAKFEDVYNIEANKIVISNYVSTSRILKDSEVQVDNVFDDREINFLTVARLTEQKAIDRLVKVHSKLILDGFKHKFYVIGDGPERENIKNLIKTCNVSDSFILLGKKDNPYPYIKKCDVFALMSLYEGLPITILEAKVLNKPILITDTAAREAVNDYEKSIIVPNTEKGVYEGIKNSIEKLKDWQNENINIYDKNDEIIKQIEKLVKLK